MKENSTLDAAADILKKWRDGQWKQSRHAEAVFTLLRTLSGSGGE